MLQAVVVTRMRARGVEWDEIAEMPGWTLKQLRAWVKRADPPAPAPPAPPPQPAPPAGAPPHAPELPALEGEPVEPRARLPQEGAALDCDLEAPPTEPPDLPGGAHWVIAPVLPGMILMVRKDAAPLVRRAAAEILERWRV